MIRQTIETMQTIELADGGRLHLHSNFLEPSVADRYFAALREECEWEAKPGIFGHMQPRLIATHGDPGVSYRYSGAAYPALPWTPTLTEIKQRIEAVEGKYNYCLLNRYRTGADSMGWHADDEPEMGPTIASLSLGATRRFRIRHNVSRQTMAFDLSHGMLIIMAGNMQSHWQHAIPKTKRPVAERINLTFRQISV